MSMLNEEGGAVSEENIQVAQQPGDVSNSEREGGRRARERRALGSGGGPASGGGAGSGLRRSAVGQTVSEVPMSPTDEAACRAWE